MKQHDSEVWEKFATAVVVGLASAALFTTCGSGDEGNSTGGEIDEDSATKIAKADESAPAASEDQLLPTNEVQGADFSGSKITGFKGAMEMFSEDSMKSEPAGCATFTNSTEELENAAGAYADIKKENVTVSVSVLKNPEMHQKHEDSLEKCSSVTATMDTSDVPEDSVKDQEISPEMQGMFSDMDMTTAMKLHREKWGPNLSVKPAEFTAHETSADISAGGTDTTATSYDIIDIVNGIIVMVSVVPTPDVPTGNMENTTDPMQIPEATPESKEVAKRRALDVFSTQAKKIMNAT